jgi:hypothetical protein
MGSMQGVRARLTSLVAVSVVAAALVIVGTATAAGAATITQPNPALSCAGDQDTLTWEPSTLPDVQGYYIVRTGTFGPGAGTWTVGPDQTSLTFTAIPRTQTFVVYAITPNGNIPFTGASVYAIMGPTIVAVNTPSSVGDHSATVLFQNDGQLVGSEPSSVDVTAAPGGETQMATWNGQTWIATFSDLENGVEYSFSGTPKNACFTNPPVAAWPAIPGLVDVTTPPLLPSGAVGQNYSTRLSAVRACDEPTSFFCTPSSLHWNLESGTLPPGLELGADGVLSGAPTSAGIYNFTVHIPTSRGNPLPDPSSSFTLRIGPSSCATHCVSVGDRSILEGDGVNQTMQFPVTLSEPATTTVTVRYSVTDISATGSTKPGGGADYKLKSGTITFKPNAGGLTPVRKYIRVTIFGDTTLEGVETFAVTLSNPTGGYAVGGATGVGAILNDDDNPAGPVTLGVGDASTHRAVLGAQSLSFEVTLSAKATGTFTVDYAITPESASYTKKRAAGGDYGGKTVGTLRFRAGATKATVSVPLWPSAEPIADKTFTITLWGVTKSSVTLLRPTATGTILTR